MTRGICRGFREISCGQFSWKLKDEGRRSEKIRKNFALGAFWHKNVGTRPVQRPKKLNAILIRVEGPNRSPDRLQAKCLKRNPGRLQEYKNIAFEENRFLNAKADELETMSCKKNYRAWEFGPGSKSSVEPLGFYRNFLQQGFYCVNPKGSAELWGTFGSPGPSFEDRLFFSVLPFSGKVREQKRHTRINHINSPKPPFMSVFL